MALNIKPDITDPKIIKLLPLIEWYNPDILCSMELFVYQGYCNTCPFGNTISNCTLRFSNNPHLQLFIEQAKQQYPEYFI